jgi:hypothetical protein
LADFDQTQFYEGVAEFVRPYGYVPYGNKKRLTFRKNIRSGWIALSFRIVERFNQIGTGFHYYNPEIYDVLRHSLRVEGRKFDRWFIAGNQLHLPNASNIWNIVLDQRISIKCHIDKVLGNFEISHVFFENLCSRYELIYQHLAENDEFSTQLVNMANGRLFSAIALACYMNRKSTVVNIIGRYKETLTIEEGRDEIINQAVEYVQKLASLEILDRQTATECQRYWTEA